MLIILVKIISPPDGESQFSAIMEKQELWQATLAKIELNLSRPNFLTWFQNTAIMEQNNDIITLAVPNAFAKDWLSNKYHKIILLIPINPLYSSCPVTYFFPSRYWTISSGGIAGFSQKSRHYFQISSSK